MRCPRCSAENERAALKCRECGAPLRAMRSSSSLQFSRAVIFTGAAFMLVIAVFLIYRILLSPAQKDVSQPVETTAAETRSEQVSTESAADSSSEASLVVGRVRIKDILGRELDSFPAALVNATWVAFPIWDCLGGEQWTFQTQDLQEFTLEQGYWQQGASLGLWKLEASSGFPTNPLSPWRPGSSLSWQSLENSTPPRRLSLPAGDRQGEFVRFTVPKKMALPGVFRQGQYVVGWTIGKEWNVGYLWTGPAGDELVENIRIRELVNVALAESQEAQFVRAMKQREPTPLEERLEAFAQGFKLLPKFSEADKPPGLRKDAILNRVRTLARPLLRENAAAQIIKILDEDAVSSSRDAEILKITTRAWQETHGFRRALRFFESVKGAWAGEPSHTQASLRSYLLSLYKQWIQSSLERELISEGWEAFDLARREFQDDWELHFLGIELAIAGNEWDRAQELLKMRSYPEQYKQRAANMEVIVLERKSEEGKVTIRFPAGAREIPVEILLNRQVLQKFIIDTGATSVSIPSEIVEALGITIDDTTPVHRVSTASGYGLAYEVEINQMELKGYRVHNVKALVLDLPGHPGLGLLGQNFLKYFQLEIDSKKGILRLSRK